MAGYLRDTWNTYIADPWKQPGIAKKVLGPVAGGLNLAFRAGDEAWRWLSRQEYQAPVGIMGNTRRDISNLFSNLGQGEFLKAASNAWSVVAGDIPADLIDLAGFRKRTNAVLAGT